MKHLFLIACFVGLLSACSSKARPKSDTDNISLDTITTNNKKDHGVYTIDFNNKNKFLSYGSVLGKPFDTIISSDTLWLFYDNQIIYTEVSEDSYLFYKKIKHWPKQIESAAGETVILVERSLGEPKGSDIVGFVMKDGKYIKRVDMNKYEWWSIQDDKDYSVKELQDIVKDHPFE